jgi:1-acyl-sn-glycerol-3-phosphate acyltransferase
VGDGNLTLVIADLEPKTSEAVEATRPVHVSNLRAAWRVGKLLFLLGLSFAHWVLLRLRGPVSLERRAQWLHESGIMVMRRMRIGLKITGTPPSHGLLVANHLSYLDILVFATAVPCYLVSKAEISTWPAFGTMARAGGTIFVDRTSRVSAESVTEEIRERLHGPVVVLFFPEGMASDGSALLPFHSRFYTPAVEDAVPLTSAAVRYVATDGKPEREMCWFGDATFLPQVWKDFGGADFWAEVRFGEPKIYTDRRGATDATFAEIQQLRADMADGTS